MRILFVNSAYYPNTTGGAELVCRKTAEALAKRGHTVDVLTIDSHYHTENINGVKVIWLDTIIGKVRKKASKFRGRCTLFLRIFPIIDFYKLKKILIAGKYDIINTHAIEDISPVIWIAAKSCKIPVVHTMHDRYLLCPRLFLLKRNGKECKKRKLVCRLRTYFYSKYSAYVSVFICPSKSLAESMPVKSVVINNGIRMVRDTQKKEYPNNRPFRFVYVGALAKHKGLNSLLNAFIQYSGKAELHIAGDGGMREDVISAAKKDNRIHYHGWIENSKMADFLRGFDCLIIPSICKENYPTVILESFNSDLPVIGSDIGGIPELVVDNETGYLFTPGDEIDILNKIQMIMDRSNWEKISLNISRIKGKYSIEHQVQNYEMIFKNTLNR